MNILLGDIHGDLSIIHRYLYRGMLDNTTLIQVGDFGLFDLTNLGITTDGLVLLDADLRDHNTKLRVIRGNHDNPKFWIDAIERKKFNEHYTNIELIPDYHTEYMDGVGDVLYIGGSISIDRNLSTLGFNYYTDEIITEPPNGFDNLPNVDLVIAHNCPSFFNFCGIDSFLKLYTDKDDNLEQDLIDEREILDKVFEETKPSQWISGHFHNHKKDEKFNCKYRCLHINELWSVENTLPLKNIKK